MPPVGFEPKISADERPKTYALDRAAIGTGIFEKVFQHKMRGLTSSSNLPETFVILRRTE
jgi:hypothetical protein